MIQELPDIGHAGRDEVGWNGLAASGIVEQVVAKWAASGPILHGGSQSDQRSIGRGVTR
jgi:hypothetical protein